MKKEAPKDYEISESHLHVVAQEIHERRKRLERM